MNAGLGNCKMTQKSHIISKITKKEKTLNIFCFQFNKLNKISPIIPQGLNIRKILCQKIAEFSNISLKLPMN